MPTDFEKKLCQRIIQICNTTKDPKQPLNEAYFQNKLTNINGYSDKPKQKTYTYKAIFHTTGQCANCTTSILEKKVRIESKLDVDLSYTGEQNINLLEVKFPRNYSKNGCLSNLNWTYLLSPSSPPSFLSHLEHVCNIFQAPIVEYSFNTKHLTDEREGKMFTDFIRLLSFYRSYPSHKSHPDGKPSLYFCAFFQKSDLNKTGENEDYSGFCSRMATLLSEYQKLASKANTLLFTRGKPENEGDPKPIHIWDYEPCDFSYFVPVSPDSIQEVSFDPASPEPIFQLLDENKSIFSFLIKITPKSASASPDSGDDELTAHTHTQASKEPAMNLQPTLQSVAAELREILGERQKVLGLTFTEEGHIYTMKDEAGKLRTDYPSVSKVLTFFCEPFNAEKSASMKSAKEITKEYPCLSAQEKKPLIDTRAEELLAEWAENGRSAADLGSMVHNQLEQYAIELFKLPANARAPQYQCNPDQQAKAIQMVNAGKKYLASMDDAHTILLGTELCLGDPALGYTGQPDKIWLQSRAPGEFGLFITDWKTNKPEKFNAKPFRDKTMLAPFNKQPENSKGHYEVQLSLYAKLILSMLQGSKYSDIKLYGCSIILLKDCGQFEEFLVPESVHLIPFDLAQLMPPQIKAVQNVALVAQASITHKGNQTKPPSSKSLALAESIAKKKNILIPSKFMDSQVELSTWINENG